MLPMYVVWCVRICAQVNAIHKYNHYSTNWLMLPFYWLDCLTRRDSYDLYGADEFGTASGVDEMMAEIYARGPIACSLNSDVPAFNAYSGGIINCIDEPGVCETKSTDHVIVIAGWGVDAETKIPYWVGRNSYGTQVYIYINNITWTWFYLLFLILISSCLLRLLRVTDIP